MFLKRRAGFSLIELVIVIVILAVISAIALPRISRGAKGADESALSQNLAVLRSAIEMYAAEHGGSYPELASFSDQLTTYSDRFGVTADAKDSASGKIYGPYLHKVPALTVGAQAGSTNVADAAGAGVAWIYDETSGKIKANCTDTELAEDGTKYNTW